jgi:hypothetical protein
MRELAKLTSETLEASVYFINDSLSLGVCRLSDYKNTQVKPAPPCTKDPDSALEMTPRPRENPDACEVKEQAQCIEVITESWAGSTEPHCVQHATHMPVSAAPDSTELRDQTAPRAKVQAKSQAVLGETCEVRRRMLGDLRTAIKFELSKVRGERRRSLSEVHRARCVQCGVHPIHGPCFVCVICQDVTLCSCCEQQLPRHPHALLKLQRQSQQSYLQQLRTLKSGARDGAKNAAGLQRVLTERELLKEKADKVMKMGFHDVSKIIKCLEPNDSMLDPTIDALVSTPS